MDWRSVKFDWNQARAFLVTAEEGSLSAAARALGMSQPTLGRQVSSLESNLGVVLFERVGRGLKLTPTGLELVDYVRVMGEAANSVSLLASAHSTSVEGTVCISASEVDAAFRLPKIVTNFRRLYPGISIDIVASNTASDLRRREADIAIRNFRPTEPNLIARKVKDMDGGLYATPGYLQKLDDPTSIQDLNGAAFIGFDHSDNLIKALTAFGLSLAKENFPVVSESHLVQWQFVKEGAGIGIMTQDIGDHDPELVRVLPDRPPLVFPLWLVCHRELKTNLKIRLVFDVLLNELVQ
jgi:DNA-binding transcriptional LysR family regulator